MLSLLLLAYWIHRCRWRLPFASDELNYEFGMGQLKRFSYREMQVATNNFSSKNILGQGGFGVVYKGRLRNGAVVTVKRLKDPNFTGEIQFQTEVEMIGLALHRNLLCLYGFCMTSNDRMLIYPYMPNGSVSDRLRAVRGTVGHIAPEYLSTGQSSEKTDVFGFGILLLELIAVQNTLHSRNGQCQKGMILDRVRELYEEKRVCIMADRQLNGLFDGTELEKAVEVVLLCTQANPILRPKISQVVRALEAARPAEEIEESRDPPHGIISHSFPQPHNDVNEASSFVIEPIELSGPR
ncbi:putative LRR receptor-like serine/threonine-protein kinase [Platanthera guangdongensis]|uniref:LRR receptor-like serine/threonine-protein kinase n=1 Tax=Platanthera guangdongensis TaxID=2320717 RepID=A0ABR2LH94_9ASPA